MARKKDEKELELPFEQAMQRLEEVVRRLEEGEVPLEEAIELYQEGMQLSRLCGQKLDVIEAKVMQLVEEDGTLTEKPFHIEEEAE
ncbi:exodeoxyribonuclease VII small subunit [Brevibacillus humidisoli]|uniref:exodeoxyribonuclease VII small subunit n=1 Tax=Brevibacillus humidisoli TaxID=2895522 RepID=UPI001E626C8D|nr:exodeoxyribonuclease VII small subunit [Brevibacillus humidisoli]UFJ42907.1 exodeoxyribonuclease VII small subunit [Brevibacillus humidisoli]